MDLLLAIAKVALGGAAFVVAVSMEPDDLAALNRFLDRWYTLEP